MEEVRGCEGGARGGRGVGKVTQGVEGGGGGEREGRGRLTVTSWPSNCATGGGFLQVFGGGVIAVLRYVVWFTHSRL